MASTSQPAGGGKRGQVSAGEDEEFRTEAGPEARQRFDDVRVRVGPETFGDRLVDVLDLAVEVEQFAGRPFDQGGGTASRLAAVATDITAVSGRAMLEALIEGMPRSRDDGRPSQAMTTSDFRRNTSIDSRSWCRIRGVPMAVIAKWLGQANASATAKIYAHNQDDALRAPARRWDSLSRRADSLAHEFDESCDILVTPRVSQGCVGQPRFTQPQDSDCFRC